MKSPADLKSRVVLYAYLLSLLVPLGFFLDALVAVREGLAFQNGWIVLFGSLLWIVAAVLALMLVRDRTKFLSRISKPLVALYSVYFTFAVLQGFATLILAKHEVRTLYRPGAQEVSITDPKLMPGLSPKIKFTVNEVGLRGPSFRGAEGSYKIITVGGSTTLCSALDDSEEWPHLLMETLNGKQKKVRVWVANAGVSGLTCVHHREFVRSLPILSQANMLAFLIGGNDLMATLAAEGAPTQAMLEADAALYRVYSDPPFRPLFRRLYIYRLTRNLWLHWKSRLESVGIQQDISNMELAREERHQRQVDPLVALPSLEMGLLEYRSRILALANECKIRGIRCVFLTQPCMARPDLPPAEQELLWFGWVGEEDHPKGYVSVADLARAMAAYNQQLLQVCREQNLECYDLAPRIPKDTTAFYDDYHFNKGGARMVADFIAQQLLSTQPFDSR